jgi:hypothetical protein
LEIFGGEKFFISDIGIAASEIYLDLESENLTRLRILINFVGLGNGRPRWKLSPSPQGVGNEKNRREKISKCLN